MTVEQRIQYGELKDKLQAIEAKYNAGKVCFDERPIEDVFEETVYKMWELEKYIA